jgi:hypothetical protein
MGLSRPTCAPTSTNSGVSSTPRLGGGVDERSSPGKRPTLKEPIAGSNPVLASLLRGYIWIDAIWCISL